MAKVLTSLHGRIAGIGNDGDLILKNGRQVTDITNDGTKNGTTVAVTELGDGVFHKTVLTCTATPFTFTDEAGQGQYAGVKLYDFPAGLLCVMGATIDGSLTLTEAAWTDTFDGDVGVGTTAMADAQNIDGTAQNIIAATALTQAVDQVANCDAQTSATLLTESGATWIDGTATAADLYLNFEIDDAAAHTDQDTGTFTGVVSFIWCIIGDN